MKFIFTNSAGQLVIGATQKSDLNDVKAIPADAANVREVTDADFPDNRYVAAWYATETEILTDLTKAKAIKSTRLAAQKATIVKEYVELLAEAEARNDEEESANITNYLTYLRAYDCEAECDSATTVDELDQITIDAYDSEE
jgi:hypothetical protein